MSNDHSKDFDLGHTLLKSIDKLDQLISAEEPSDIFDIKTNSESAKHYHELKRLRISLQQYSEKDCGLQYLGFIGHFSSGKSTTINSLLKKAGLEGDRATNLHPQDTSITLITDSENESRLIGMHRTGELGVGTIFKKSQVLQNKVIVDTPGSGDPSIIDEMVRDFLPICDMIIFVMSSTSPLNSTDLPILEKAYKELPFVPIKFIVTRTNEFKIDLNESLTAGNFDETEKNKFVTRLITRLSDSLPGFLINEDDIFFIDNIEEYGLEKIDDLLRNTHEYINDKQIHSKKLKYYERNANRIKKFFSGVIAQKDKSLDDLLDTAKNNHENYQKTINISHNRLTEDWARKRSDLLDYKAEHKEELEKNHIDVELENDVEETSFSKNIMREISEGIVGYTQEYCSAVERSIKSTLAGAILRQKSNFETALVNRENDILLDCTPLSNEHISASIMLNNFETAIPKSFKTNISEGVSKQFSWIEKAHVKLKQSISKLHSVVKSRDARDNGESLHKESVTQLDYMFDEFMQSVTLYRQGILSLSNMKLIENVGLAQDIEKLVNAEVELVKKEGWRESLNLTLFPDFEERKLEFNNLLSEMNDELVNLKTNEALKLDENNLQQTDEVINEIINNKYDKITGVIADTVDSIKNDFSSRYIEYVNTLVKRVNGSLEKNKIHMDLQVKSIAQKRKIKFLRYTGFGFLFGLTGYLAYLYFNYPAPTTLLNVFLLGLLVNLISTGGGWVLAKIGDSSNIDKSKVEHEYSNDTKEELKEIIAEIKFDDWAFLESKVKVLNRVLSNELNLISTSALERVKKISLNNNYRKKLFLFTELEKISSKYISSVNNYIDSLSSYYVDIGSNLEKINSIALTIKEDSILPSLDMFESKSKSIKGKSGLIKELEMIS